MKYFLSILACLMICQVSFSQHDLSQPVSKEQIKKDKQAYISFLQKITTYEKMQEYKDAIEMRKQSNFTKTMELMKTAAAKGNPLAEEEIGKMYTYGNGVKEDLDLAREWLWRAVDNGNIDAFTVMSKGYSTDKEGSPQPKPFFNALLRGAYAGSSFCCLRLAVAYEDEDLLEKSNQKAKYWRKQSAIAYNESKKYIIKEVNQEAIDPHDLSKTVSKEQIQKDKAAYVEYLKKVAFYIEMPELKAAFEADRMKDYKKMMELMKVAGAKGNPIAEENLGSLYAGGAVEPKDDGEAFKWFWRAVDHGNMDAFESISDTYDFSDEETAYQATYFLNALLRGANAGSAICCVLLADAYKYGDGTPKNNAKARYWSKKAEIAKIERKKLLEKDN